jgi:hypothetical protein
MDADAAVSEDNFAKATAVSLLQPGLFAAHVPDGWQQGRGAFGGLVLATLTRAMDASVGAPERQLRVLTGEILGPVLPGDARIEVAPLREGTGMSFFEAKLLQDSQVLARATGTYGRTRVTDRDIRRALTPMPDEWITVPVAEVGPPLGPVFAQHMEYRVTGPPPFAGGSVPVSEGWIRPRTALPAWGAPELVAMADAWWPAALATESAPRPHGHRELHPSVTVQPRRAFTHRARCSIALAPWRRTTVTSWSIAAFGPQPGTRSP